MFPVEIASKRAGKIFEHDIDGDGKSYTFGIVQDHGIDPQYVSKIVDEGTSAVAGIDGRVYLQISFITVDLFPVCGENPGSHGIAQSHGAADGINDLARLKALLSEFFLIESDDMPVRDDGVEGLFSRSPGLPR
jgi:hypothetical protein